MKYELGIMTNVWVCEADNVDIAVATLILQQQTNAPIAVYKPEKTESKFCLLGIDYTAEQLNEFTDFLRDNKNEIRQCNKTLKLLTQ